MQRQYDPAGEARMIEKYKYLVFMTLITIKSIRFTMRSGTRRMAFRGVGG